MYSAAIQTCVSTDFVTIFFEYFASNDKKSWIKSAWSFYWLCVTLWHSATVAGNFIMDADNFRRQMTQWIDRKLSSHKTLRRNLAINNDDTTDILHSIRRYCACLIHLVVLSSCDKDTQSEEWRPSFRIDFYIILFCNFNG